MYLMDYQILPRYHRLREGLEHIYFDDLWYLFHVGDLVCFNDESLKGMGINSHTSQIWRIISFRTDRQRDRKASSLDAPAMAHELVAYCIDHDGTSYMSVRKVFRIDSYAGSRDPLGLSIKPLRLLENYQQIVEDSKVAGKLFTQQLQKRFLHHDGLMFSVWHGSNDLERIYKPEYFKGEVAVDLTEAYFTHPSWRPKLSEEGLQEIHRLAGDEIGAPGVVLDPWEDLNAAKDTENMPALTGNIATTIPENDLALLPKTIPVFAIKEREFVLAHPKNLSEVQEPEQIFAMLRIPEKHKMMIRGLIASHFERRELEAAGMPVDTQDLISGKGQGLIILLHGSPGVGKTATAEAIARETKKPLFSITCGDLGYTPSDVETSLKSMFRRAAMWNCVTLLDEADVFLSQRNKTDLKRNALVSVFLRSLEYYSGILFLTTNRPGALDEAIKSRVHLSLYYPPLGKQETLDVFDINLDRLHRLEEQRYKASKQPSLFIFRDDIRKWAATHFDKCGKDNGSGRWNGRQIRNAFQIASALALYELRNNPGAQAQLRPSHFDTVSEATTSYDKYRAAVLGKADDELAHQNNDR
ncbi:P-loop containing nucleoside triphosphate hydrolase protein, partial [Massarina eburnea CBS 473.64]